MADTALVSEPETPFDPIETSPDPVASEHQASIETAAANVEDEPTPAATESGEPVPTAGAQVPDVAPAAPESSTKTTRAKKAPKAPKEAKAVKGEGVRANSKTATVIALMQREGGATLTDIMPYASHCTSLA